MLATLVVLFITGVLADEVPTPASLLGPRNFNFHPYSTRQFLEETSASPTKQGPVTFPNDGPPPAKTPLIVTSRPLLEAIARSDLTNNTVAESSYINTVTYNPYTATKQDPYSVTNQDPYSVTNQDTYSLTNQDPYSVTNQGQYTANQDFVPHVPYAEMLKKAEERGFLRASGYSDYEQRTVLPPIYKALSEHARQNVLNAEKPEPSPKPALHYYQPKIQDYSQDYSQEYNDISNEDQNSDSDQNKNYAFSYTVKDHKTGDDFSHKEQSHGSATNGEYRVRLPDGREQVVSYTADENGYKADVRYIEDESHSNEEVNNNQNQYNTNDLKLDTKYNVESDNRIENYNNYNTVNNNLNTNLYQSDYKVKEETPLEPPQYDSSEYYNDYSDKNYVPGSKFDLFNPSSTESYVTKVKPTYGEIKHFLNKIHTTSAPNHVNQNDVDVNKPYNDVERVVVIGGNGNRYTDVSKDISNLPNFVTPSPHLLLPKYSSFKDSSFKDPTKPILSDSYINRINKYLTFNKK